VFLTFNSSVSGGQMLQSGGTEFAVSKILIHKLYVSNRGHVS
jgi:hypothetical protein